MRKDGHFGTKVCTNVPPKKPNKHKEPTVLRLNLKPSHKDVRIFSIVTDASCDWNTARNTILNAVNKAEKKINTLISVFMPSNNRILPNCNYVGYFLHLGPLHRLHLPHPRSIVPALADFLALVLS